MTTAHKQPVVNVPHSQRGKGFGFLQLLRSLETARWYALDIEGRTVAHGFASAAACAEAAENAYETAPYEPRKRG